MADIASTLLEFPPDRQTSAEEYDKRVNAFLNTLTQISPNKLAAVDLEQDLLEIINPSVNSISYLYVLKSRLDANHVSKSPTKDAANLNKAILFLNSFDGVQMRYVGLEFRKVVDFVDRRHSLAPNHAIPAIRSAILRLDPSGGTLTSTHLAFVDLCLANRGYTTAIEVLDKVIHSYPTSRPSTVDGPFPCSPHSDSSSYITEASGLTPKLNAGDVHEYYLLGAMIYLALAQWEKALLFLELVLTSPTNGGPSGFMLEAYQKWLLVECIVNGKAPDAPKGVGGSVTKILAACSKGYVTLAEAFRAQNLAKLQAEINVGSQLWFDDGNLGLVQELPKHLPRFFVTGLQNTFSAVPLTDVAQWLGRQPDATHAFVEELIKSGALNASIDFRDGADQGAVLRFFSNGEGPLAKTEEELHARLVEQTQRTNEMMSHVKIADRRLMLTKEYIDSVRKKLKSKDDDAPVGDGMDTGVEWSAYQDEDLMVDS